MAEAYPDRAAWGEKQCGETMSTIYCNECGREVVGSDWSVESAAAAWNELSRLRATLAACQLESGTTIWRQQLAIAPILRHASAHEFAPPIKFSRDRCRELRKEVERG